MAKKTTKKKTVKKTKKQDKSNFNAAHKARDKQLRDKRPHFIIDTKSCQVLVKEGKGEYVWSRKSIGSLKFEGEFRAKLTLGQLRARGSAKLPATCKIVTYPMMLKYLKSKPAVQATPKIKTKLGRPLKVKATGNGTMARYINELVKLSAKRDHVQADLNQIDTQIKQLAKTIAS